MKVEMELVKSPNNQTKALQPKRLMIDERWADRLEQASKGKFRRVIPIPAADVAFEEDVAGPRRKNRRFRSTTTTPIEE